MSRPADIAVVGAGPAGSSAAREAARAGFSVVLLDKAAFPRSKPCGGGLSLRAAALLGDAGIWDRIESRAYRITGMRLVSPDGRSAMVQGDGTAWVLGRRELDAILAGHAVEAGARFIQGVKVEGLTGRGGRVSGVRCGDTQVPARWVIVANGAGSRFNPDSRPTRILHTCMAWFEGISFTPNILEMIYDPALLPHYGWLFPESPSRVNIGICLLAAVQRERSIRSVFRGFLGRHFGSRLTGAVQSGPWRGYPISTTSIIEHAAPPGVLLAGEANRLVNPATGEGISYAIESGIIAARTIAEAEERGLEPSDAGHLYHTRLLLSMQKSFLGSRLFCEVGPGVLNTVTRISQSRLGSALTSSAYVSL